jgi:ribosomal protein L40E
MSTQAHRKIAVEITCPQCHARNPRRAHICRNCRAQIAPYKTQMRSRRLAKNLGRPLAHKLEIGKKLAQPLADTLQPQFEKMKTTSEEMLANEWRAIQERWRGFAEQMRKVMPSLPETVEWLTRLEGDMIEITGIQLDATSRSAAHLPLTEEFHWLRGRLSQAIADMEQLRRFRCERDLGQMIEVAVAGLRFIIAAVAILSISLDIADRLNPRKMLRRNLRGEAL